MPGKSTEAHWHKETKWFGFYRTWAKHTHPKVFEGEVIVPEEKGWKVHFIFWIVPFWIEF